MMRKRRSWKGVLVALGLVLAVPIGGVRAASPHTVDPATLSPALNPHYAPYDRRHRTESRR